MTDFRSHIPPGARGVELGERATVSVAVIGPESPEALVECLRSLSAQARRHDAEVVVEWPGAWGEPASEIGDACPHLRFVPVEGTAPPAIARSRILAETRGAIVALTGARRVPADWIGRLLGGAAADRPDAAGVWSGLIATHGEGGALAVAYPPHPFLSVIVPAHNAAEILPRSLSAVHATGLPREAWELVVIDDGSMDATELVAAQYADTVIRLAGNPHGPAYARNRGAEAARGHILAFVDADVVIHRDTLARIATRFAQQPELSAVFGSYDAYPSHQSLVSQYRNLLHHYVHRRGAGPAETFWSGLGAVRASVFSGIGMFDEWHYSEPQIEDIELGRRLRRANHAIVLDPDIQGTHLKRWTFWGMVRTDFQHRGVPWMWLILREGGSARQRALNLRVTEKLCTLLVGAAVVALGAALVLRAVWPLLVSAAALAVVGAINLPFYRYLRRHRSFEFALGIFPLHVTYYVTNVVAVGAGWLFHQLFGAPSPPPERQAAAQVGLKSWPPPIRRPGQSMWVPLPRASEKSTGPGR